MTPSPSFQPVQRVRKRRRILAAAALATAAASIWALNDDADELATRRPAGSLSASATTLKPADSTNATRAMASDMVISTTITTPLSLPERSTPAMPRRNLFASALIAPAKALAAPAPASAPPAITLPFTFGGRLVTAAGASVLLNEGAMTYVLAPGGTQGDFRFENDTGSQLEFIHVPSGERLVLALQP